jgi:Amt family ammonium transporter
MGKYIKINGKTNVKAIPGHNIPMAALGVFILWFGWFGFNAGSTTAGTNLSIATIAVTTNLAAAAGAILAMTYTWIRFGKPDPSMSLNGGLAGLVAITASCAVVSPVSAVIIGAIAGVLVVLSVTFFDKILKIDDPVGAVSVHGVCGAFGTLMVGLFAESAYAEAAGLGQVNGLFFGGGWSLLGIQLIGVVAVLRGLDIGEHGIESYSGFQIFSNQ